jgi:hypothetical protein
MTLLNKRTNMTFSQREKHLQECSCERWSVTYVLYGPRERAEVGQQFLADRVVP